MNTNKLSLQEIVGESFGERMHNRFNARAPREQVKPIGLLRSLQVDFRVSVITPTLLRPTLFRACESVPRNWQHIVVPDRSGDYGNRARYRAFDQVRGDYIMYLDDDDYYTSSVQEVVERALEDSPLWVLFPVKRLGTRFFNLPPGVGNTTSNQFAYRADLGLRYPFEELIDNDPYRADGTLIERLKKFPFKAVREAPEIAVVEKQGMGKL